MVSRKQKKLWRYVEEGSLLKLKSYLRKHKDVELNFTQGKRMRGLLHLICTDGEDSLLTVLIKHGADPLMQDKKGDTPLHLAIKRALKYGKRGEFMLRRDSGKLADTGAYLQKVVKGLIT